MSSAKNFREFAAAFATLTADGYADLLRARAAAPKKALDLLQGYLERFADGQLPAGRSHVHNNGFFKLSLWRDPVTLANIRVHFWQEDAARPTSVHNHRWDFSSAAICGRLRFENFEIDDFDSSRPAWDLYRLGEADHAGAKDTQYWKTSSLRKTCEYELVPGAIHSLDCTQLHRTFYPAAGAATLVLVGPPRRSYSELVQPAEESGRPHSRTESNRSLEPAEVVETIGSIIRAVNVD